MTKTEQVLCDGCDKDITYTTNAVGYRIVLGSQSLSNAPSQNPYSVATLMHVENQLPQDKHFCGMSCLRAWLDVP